MARSELSIGKVAEQVGVNAKTIRYYEALGLLPQPPRGQNRYRLYSRDAVELLLFIKKAQGLGFTLAEIKEIVAFRRLGGAPCVHVRALVRGKIAELDQRLRDLVTLRKKLRDLLARWEDRPRGRKIAAVVCPHIEGTSLDPRPRA